MGVFTGHKYKIMLYLPYNTVLWKQIIGNA